MAQFAGLSLLIHLLIILSAKIVGIIRGEHTAAAFETRDRNGGVFHSERLNMVMAYAILVVVNVYIFFLGGVALRTAYVVGENEPQRQLLSYAVNATAVSVFVHPVLYINAALLLLIVVLIFLYEHIQHFFFIRSIHRFVDVCYRGVLATGRRLTILRRKCIDMLMSGLGIAYGHTIGRPFAVSLHSVLLRVTFGLVLSAVFFGIPFFFASAQIVEPGFESEVVADGFTFATAIDFTPDGRIFVAEKGGVIRVVKNGVLLPDPLITLTDINTFGDRGLLGIAVDPNFSLNGYVYLSYTYENTPGLNIAGPKTGRIVRITVVDDTALESSKFVLVGTVGGDATNTSCEDYAVTDDCIPSDSNSHSVGGLRFGPDGKLYATLGDGADFTNVDARALRAQNIDALAGKLLRINTDGTAPTDNPFYNGNQNANRSKVYAFGLRNAFRFNFNPTTGKLYVGDVGWSSWEELNLVTPGANFGWPCREGNGPTTYGCTPSTTATDPLYTYPHNASGAGSITSGAFASNNAYPDQYDTSFFFGDYAQMWMKRLVLNASGTAVVSVENFVPDTVWPVEIVTGPDGTVYYLDIAFGTLNRYTHTSGNRRPVVSVSANPTSGLTPLPVSFSSGGTSDPDGDPITYAWDFGDGVTANTPNPSHTYTVNGAYTAALTVTDSNGAEVTKSVAILVGNQAPTALITSPSSGSLYTELEMLTVVGTGTDPETGALPPSAYAWQVILHHNTHIHTLQTITGTSTITFQADDHNASDVYLEVVLTVTDSVGLTNTKSINLYLDNGIGSGNLVSNASLEVEGALPTSPLDWYQGWFGTMDPVFTYPVSGFVGNRAAKLEVLSYTSGSAKWYFTPAFVTPGSEYTFSNMYLANVPTNLVVQYGKADGTYNYVSLGTVPSVTEPTRISRTFTIPQGIETATVFHELASVGVLTVDDYSLALAGGDVTPPNGVIMTPLEGASVSGIVPVSVNANDNVGLASAQLLVDGTPVGVPDSEEPFDLSWNTEALTDGVHTLGARILDTSANEGITPFISVTVSNTPNLFDNGDFEIASGTNPRSWQPAGWGTLQATYTYPTSGHAGNGIGITVTQANLNDTGDARWSYGAVPVQSGTEYTYETWYKASTITDVLGRYQFADGTSHYFGLIKEIPGTAAWTKISNSFVPPVGAVSVTLDHAISAGGATLTTDDTKLFVSGTGTPSEINAPVVDFVSPLGGATLSGTVTLTATSSDDTAVVGVFFAVNGSPIGIEDTTVPYQATLNTTTYPNGTYTLKATTRDPYGNNSNKTIQVTINNSTSTPGGGNLVPNGDFETAGPAGWNQGGWGTNTRTFMYPATGFTGNGARVTVSGYTNGDAKWYFNPITITPGTTYTVGERYNSTVASQMLARYTQTGGAFTYTVLDNLASTGGAWQTYAKTITAPAGVTQITLFHLIAGNGQLTLDDVSILGPGGTTTPDTTAPVVSVTAPASGATVSGTTTVTVNATDAVGVTSVSLLIDGVVVGSPDTTSPYSFSWNTPAFGNGTHSVSARANDATGNIGSSTPFNVTVSNVVVPPATTTNLVPNGDFETAGPAGWNQGGWGTNTRTFMYPATGFTGNGARVTVSGYTNGDAKWYFNPITITPGTTYTVGERYNSTVASQMLARYTQTGGAFTYTVLDNLASTGGAWQTYAKTITAPAGVTQITLFHLIAGNGQLTLDDVSILGPGGTTTDTVLPTASVTSPGAGATLSGTTTVTATATDNVGVLGVTLLIDGNTVGAEDTTSPYSFSWNTASVGNGAHTVHVRARDAAGNLGTSGSVAVAVSNATGTPDATPPSVSVTNPTNGSTLSGTTNVSVTATDAVGVTSVSLLIDGAVVGSPDTTQPYNFTLDTVTLANGAHTISAQASDAAGNTGTAFGVGVTVSNSTTTPPLGDNLILNPDLETLGTGGNPLYWNRGGWGTNNRTFTYPVLGQSGNGAQVSMTTYTNGDAKWFFNEVAVTPGALYTFTYSYTADVPTNLTVRYTYGDGSISYVGVENPPMSAVWATRSATFVPPTNAVTATVMHILTQVGTLTIDNQSLITGNPNAFSRGKVTFSFDDGWLEHSTIAGPVLDDAGIDGTFYVVSEFMNNSQSGEKVTNGTLETPGTGGDPANWNRGGWGTNTRTYTYPATGFGGNGAQVTIADYVDGDAKWYFTPISVAPGNVYTISERYQSTVVSELLARFMKSDGTFVYQFLESLPSSGGAWQSYTTSITTQTDVTDMTLFHVIHGNGSLTIDNVSVMQVESYISGAQVSALHAGGHEIGAHTRTHTSLTTLSTADKESEIAGSRQDLIAAGFGPVTTIAYPYGEFDAEVQQITQDAGFTLGRSVLRGYNDSTTDHYALKIQQVGRTRTLAEMKGWIDQAALSKTWLIFMFHQISNNVDETFGITESDFRALVDHAALADVDTITVAEGAILLQ